VRRNNTQHTIIHTDTINTTETINQAAIKTVDSNSRQQTADSRQQTANSKQQTADSRQQADSKQTTSRQQAGNKQAESTDSRQRIQQTASRQKDRRTAGVLESYGSGVVAKWSVVLVVIQRNWSKLKAAHSSTACLRSVSGESAKVVRSFVRSFVCSFVVRRSSAAAAVG